MKLTAPQPASVHPTIPGVYLTRRGAFLSDRWRAFDGKNWRYGIMVTQRQNSPYYESAVNKEILPSDMLDFTWQGLAQDPNETD